MKLRLVLWLTTNVLILLYKLPMLPAHASEGKVIGVVIHIYVDQKKLNRTLVIDSPFQKFAVGFLVEFID